MKDNNRRIDQISDSEISEQVKDIRISPSEEFKEKTFQSLLTEAGHAREQHKRQKSRGGGFKVGAAATIIAAALLFVLFAGEIKLDFNLSGEKETPEQQEKWVNAGDYGKTARDESKEFSLSGEGGERRVSYRLFDQVYLPFSTYVPVEGWREETIRTEDRNGLKLVREDNQAIYIEMVFFQNRADETEAKNLYSKRMDQLANEGNEAIQSAQGEAGWALSSHIITGSMSGAASFGKYKDQYFYIIYPTLPNESEKPVLDEWQWKDSESPLIR